MIRIISGNYGGKKTPKDPPFILTDAEEARLVRRGVAEYVYEQEPANAAPEGFNSPAYDMSMTEKQLRGLAEYHGVDVSKLRGKQKIIDALDKYFAEMQPSADEDEGNGADDNDAPEDPDAPQLNAAAPQA